MPRKHKNTTGITDYELDALARALLPAFQEFLSIEKNRKKYEEWLVEHKQKKTIKTPKKSKRAAARSFPIFFTIRPLNRKNQVLLPNRHLRLLIRNS